VRRAAYVVVLVVVVAACDGGADPLVITGAEPAYGPLVGGTRITLAGTGFAPDQGDPSRVLVGGREAPLAHALLDSALEVVIPPGERPGDAEVVVFNANGSARARGVFHYSAPPTIDAVDPPDVLYSSTSTVITLTGTGFLDEGAGEVHVVVDGQLAADVQVASDVRLTFTAPPGPALARAGIEVVDVRGRASEARALRYIPSTRGGLLLFSAFGPAFAQLFDPVDNSTVAIPRVAGGSGRFTAVVPDANGDYWGFDRGWQFGRIDMRTQRLEAPIATQSWFPTMIRDGDRILAIDRGALRFGAFDPGTGAFTAIGTEAIPCCGSYGLASDGTTLYFTARQGAAVIINTVDGTTGAFGTPVTLVAPPGFHVEEMRFFDGTLYATSRDGTLVVIDPTTGATASLPWNLGRFNAMAVYP